MILKYCWGSHISEHSYLYIDGNPYLVSFINSKYEDNLEQTHELVFDSSKKLFDYVDANNIKRFDNQIPLHHCTDLEVAEIVLRFRIVDYDDIA